MLLEGKKAIVYGAAGAVGGVFCELGVESV